MFASWLAFLFFTLVFLQFVFIVVFVGVFLFVWDFFKENGLILRRWLWGVLRKHDGNFSVFFQPLLSQIKDFW